MLSEGGRTRQRLAVQEQIRKFFVSAEEIAPKGFTISPGGSPPFKFDPEKEEQVQTAIFKGSQPAVNVHALFDSKNLQAGIGGLLKGFRPDWTSLFVGFLGIGSGTSSGSSVKILLMGILALFPFVDAPLFSGRIPEETKRESPNNGISLSQTSTGHLGSSLSLTSFDTLGSSLSMSGFIEFGSSLSLTSTGRLGSSLSLTSFDMLGSSLSVSGFTEFGSSLSVTSTGRLGSSLSLTSFDTLGSSLSVSGFTKFGSSLSVTSMWRLGSSLSLTSFDTLGSSLFVSGFTQLGSSLSLTSMGRLGSSLSLTSFDRLGWSLSVSGFTEFGSSLSLTSTTVACDESSDPQPNTLGTGVVRTDFSQTGNTGDTPTFNYSCQNGYSLDSLGNVTFSCTADSYATSTWKRTPPTCSDEDESAGKAYSSYADQEGGFLSTCNEKSKESRASVHSPDTKSLGSLLCAVAVCVLFFLFWIAAEGEISALRAELKTLQRKKEQILSGFERAAMEEEDSISRFLSPSFLPNVKVTVFGPQEKILVRRVDPSIGWNAYRSIVHDSDVVILPPFPELFQGEEQFKRQPQFITQDMIQADNNPRVGMRPGSVIIDYGRFPGTAHGNGRRAWCLPVDALRNLHGQQVSRGDVDGASTSRMCPQAKGEVKTAGLDNPLYFMI
uniref:Sushi domain-containing protein n=1 Tax=Chromera velia CCMP2878 TaxID=1169474 RepID=A0A0G4FN89_9ALVE|eukprot:Cvel_17884.t1-p1 / transcript=Cvel_17884.t1 / gene=Cvel_17884 / organism=Chromera_velia_CCMP2878 / gene_product=RE1-silencing transcription factor A, putative / transcript_product=RE1-silencing transcription factor A, putative / location=Cvel_scaffold1451:2785-8169(+) / protein_length=664 / sequence_SO=supercontig / SO=protein_coding / is_pseudo=false